MACSFAAQVEASAGSTPVRHYFENYRDRHAIDIR
jgi:hypothetical protein